MLNAAAAPKLWTSAQQRAASATRSADMNIDDSYLTRRLAERRRRVLSGVAGVGLLMALGLGLLLSYPAPNADTPRLGDTTAAAHTDTLTGTTTTALR
jgi:hypothetical protein